MPLRRKKLQVFFFRLLRRRSRIYASQRARSRLGTRCGRRPTAVRSRPRRRAREEWPVHFSSQRRQKTSKIPSRGNTSRLVAQLIIASFFFFLAEGNSAESTCHPAPTPGSRFHVGTELRRSETGLLYSGFSCTIITTLRQPLCARKHPHVLLDEGRRAGTSTRAGCTGVNRVR